MSHQSISARGSAQLAVSGFASLSCALPLLAAGSDETVTAHSGGPSSTLWLALLLAPTVVIFLRKRKRSHGT